MPTVDIDRDAAHEAAQRELGKPIYPRPSLTERLTEWLDEQLFRLALKGSALPGGWFTVMVLLIIVAMAVFVAVRVARRTMRTNRGVEYRLFGAAELSAAEHRFTAEQFAARGQWAAAIRHRLRAVARHLEEVGLLSAVPGRTAGELARDAAVELPGLTSEFTAAATVFNDVTYGERPGTPDAYRLVADLDERLRTRAAAARPGTMGPADKGGWVQVG